MEATRGRFGEWTWRDGVTEARAQGRPVGRARVRRYGATTTKVEREMRIRTVKPRCRGARLPTTNKPLGDGSVTELQSKDISHDHPDSLRTRCHYRDRPGHDTQRRPRQAWQGRPRSRAGPSGRCRRTC